MNDSKTPAALFQRLVHSILTSPGITTPALRQAINRYAGNLRSDTSDEGEALPAEVAAYVKKVVLYAYKTTDRDLAMLQQAGYSEDAIFEITLNAATSAAAVQLNRGLAALKGEI
jgi:hypothetical protein